MSRRERFWAWLARRLPRDLVYHAVIRAGAHATTGRWSDTVVPEVSFVEVLNRWEKR